MHRLTQPSHLLWSLSSLSFVAGEGFVRLSSPLIILPSSVICCLTLVLVPASACGNYRSITSSNRTWEYSPIPENKTSPMTIGFRPPLFWKTIITTIIRIGLRRSFKAKVYVENVYAVNIWVYFWTCYRTIIYMQLFIFFQLRTMNVSAVSYLFQSFKCRLYCLCHLDHHCIFLTEVDYSHCAQQVPLASSPSLLFHWLRAL